MVRTSARVLALVACFLVPGFAHADVLTFQFTGRIDETVLQSGTQQTLATAFPSSWIGQTVSGTVRMDFGIMEPRLLETDRYSQVSKTADEPYAHWLTVSVNQPDGSTLVIPSGPVLDIELPPGFCPECDDAYSQITNGWVSANAPGDPALDSFYVQRNLINGLEPFPRQTFMLNLAGVGPAGAGLADSVDYRQANFDPSFANTTNFGYVDHFPSAGQHLSYAFTVLSLSSQVAAVPEPGVMVLAGAGGLMLLLARRRARTKASRTLITEP
jgi:hypothetical protein